MDFRIYEMNDGVIEHFETKEEAIAAAKSLSNELEKRGHDTWVEPQEKVIKKDPHGGPIVIWREAK